MTGQYLCPGQEGEIKAAADRMVELRIYPAAVQNMNLKKQAIGGDADDKF